MNVCYGEMVKWFICFLNMGIVNWWWWWWCCLCRTFNWKSLQFNELFCSLHQNFAMHNVMVRGWKSETHRSNSRMIIYYTILCHVMWNIYYITNFDCTLKHENLFMNKSRLIYGWFRLSESKNRNWSNVRILQTQIERPFSISIGIDLLAAMFDAF